MNRWQNLALVAAVMLAAGLSARAGEKAEPEEAGPAGTLQAQLVRKKVTRRWRGRERTFDALRLEVRNNGKQTVLLPYPLEVKLSARDAEGKEVPRREDPRARGGRDEEKPKGEDGKEEKKDPKQDEQAVTLTVLKPGQKLETDCRTFRLNFPAAGKYTVWAVVEGKPSDGEVLPGRKLWSGELKSNELEWEVRRVWRGRGGQRGRRDRRDRPQKPADKPAEAQKEPGKTEEF
jgi:hypothetical protein